MENELDNHPDLVDTYHDFPGRWHVSEIGRVISFHTHDEYTVKHIGAKAWYDQDIEYHERVIVDLAFLAALTFGLFDYELEKVGQCKNQNCEIGEKDQISACDEWVGLSLGPIFGIRCFAEWRDERRHVFGYKNNN